LVPFLDVNTGIGEGRTRGKSLWMQSIYAPTQMWPSIPSSLDHVPCEQFDRAEFTGAPWHWPSFLLHPFSVGW
jgi:hypothetical protein